VRYLRYADAEKIASKLKEQLSGVAARLPVALQARGGAAGADKQHVIWAEPETNALVITAPPKMMRSLRTVIDKLDIRARAGAGRGDHRRGERPTSPPTSA
jgi:general secretion pathway protein D